VVGRTALRKWLRGFVGFPVLLVLTVATIASAWPPQPASAASSVDTVYHWGAFSIGANSSDDELKVPTAVTLPGQVEEVASTNSAEYALLTDGTVYAWGGGQDGELGNGSTSNSFDRPVQVKFPSGVVIKSLPTDAMPFNTALAVDEQGNAWGWGSNSYGQLCRGNKRKYLTPVEVPLPDVTSIAGAFDHALYDSDGTVYACGGNASGDLGDGSTNASSNPVVVSGLGNGDVTGLYAAYSNSGALLSNGDYFDWGLNSGGQLGDGRSVKRSMVPVHVSLRAEVTEVALGGSLSNNGQTLVELSDGTYWAWGTDQFGQLGDGSTTNESSPIQIHPPGDVTYTLLASGGETSYGVSSTGEVYAWGNGSTGQLGDGKKTKAQLTPVKVESGAIQISSTAHNVVTF
jgi:alpha-tubulin suppressor-like RCC1 family protein